MKGVQRSEVLDWVTYQEQSESLRAKMRDVKKPRRIHAGEHLTFLFENHDTTLHQIQEMVLAERMVKEAAIQHEIETYNGLLGGDGELGCSLLIEIEEASQRKELLTQWLGLPQHLYATLANGKKIRPRFDAAQVGDDRLSAVQYLKFPVGGVVPVALGADHPNLTVEVALTDEQKKALAADLA